MKKLFVFAMVATVLTIFSGCQKEEPALTGEQPQVAVTNPMFAGLDTIAFSVEDNRLVFESEEEYQKCIDFLAQLGDENFPAFEKEIGFDSYRKVFEKDEVKSELFVDELYQTLLNPEMEIVVGNYLFREEPENEITLAFYVEGGVHCNLKSSKALSADYRFSWYENAFSILSGEEEAILKSTMGKPKCRSNNDKKKDWQLQSFTYPAPNQYAAYAYYVNIKSKLCYQYSGIFKSIIAKIKTDPLIHEGSVVNGQLFTLKLSIDGDYEYLRKNENKQENTVNESTIVNNSQNGSEWRPFHGTKTVRCYNVTMNFKWEVWANCMSPQWIGQNDDVTFNINCNSSYCASH